MGELPDESVKIPTDEFFAQLFDAAGITGLAEDGEPTSARAREAVRAIADADANVKGPTPSVVLPFGWTDQFVNLRGVSWHAAQIFFTVLALVKTGGLGWIALAPVFLDGLDKLRKDFAVLRPGELQFYDAVLRGSKSQMQAQGRHGESRFVSEAEVRAQLERLGNTGQIGLDRILGGLCDRGILEARTIDATKRYAVRM